MNEFNERAIEAAAKFLTHQGHEIVETGWRAADGIGIDIVSRDDEGTVVFTDVSARRGFDKGMPGENAGASRERREIAAAAWLSEHGDDPELLDITVRFDDIAMMVVGENRALLRHHVNCLSTMQAEPSD